MSPKRQIQGTTLTHLHSVRCHARGFWGRAQRSGLLGASLIQVALVATSCRNNDDVEVIGTETNSELCATSCDAWVHDTYDNPATFPPEAEQLGHSIEILGYGYDEVAIPTVNKNLRSVAAGAPNYFDPTSNVVAGRIKLINAATTSGNLLENKTIHTLNTPHVEIGELGFALLGVDIRSGEVMTTLVDVDYAASSHAKNDVGATPSTASAMHSEVTAHTVSVNAGADKTLGIPGASTQSYAMTSTAANPGTISNGITGTLGSNANATSSSDGLWSVEQVNSQNRYKGYGEELLAGAPGSYKEKGAVVWYRHVGKSGAFEYGGEITAPNGETGERFGAALAAPSTLSIRTPADNVADHPTWIAVGAPGRDRVYIFIVVPGLASPLAYTQTITGPTTPGGADFGTSLAVADFNLDGRQDLAIGAPSQGTGRVYVYFGQTGFLPLAPTPYEVAPTGLLSPGGEFGHSLAAGNVRRNEANRPVLVVGAPGYNDGTVFDSGGLCQFQFSGTSAWTMTTLWQRCDENPDPYAGDRYGHAVAVGNFRATNGSGSTFGDCAAGEEIAVGIPGKSNSGVPDTGSVKILAQGMDGGEPAEIGQILRGSRAAEQFGRALASDFVQQTGHEDLAIGAPLFDASRGSISLTKAEPPGGPNDPISGKWRSQDSLGNDFDVFVVWNSAEATLTVDMVTTATVEARNGGQLCTIFGQPLSMAGQLSFGAIPWTTTAVTHSETVALAFSGNNVQVDISYNSGTHTFSLDIDETVFPLSLMSNNCSIVNEPFVFEKISGAVCD